MSRISPNKRLNITDETLRNELISRGQHVGPIVESTRDLYHKILIRLMNEEQNELNESSPTVNRDEYVRPPINRYRAGYDTSDVSPANQQLSRISIINRKLLIFVAIVLALIIAYIFNY